MDTRFFGLRYTYSVDCTVGGQLQQTGAVARTARDIEIFGAETVPPPPDRYRQAG